MGLGLLEDDNEWDNCLTEVAGMQTGVQLRLLFAIILTESNPADPLNLWESYKHSICDDCAYLLRIYGNILSPSSEQIYSLGLCKFEEILSGSGKSLQQVGLPEPSIRFDITIQTVRGNRLMQDQLSWNQEELCNQVLTMIPLLNQEQQYAYDSVIEEVNKESGKMFFLDGPGGTGKTYVENLILAKVRSQGHIALAVASSGIAALLLEGGRTAHSIFRIPLILDNKSCCNIDHGSMQAEVFKIAKLIIWDEATMQHHYGYEAVSRMLQDIRQDNNPFGGLTVLFAGDFRQCLPVVPGGSRAQIVSATLKQSSFWSMITLLQLEKNVQLLQPGMSLQRQAEESKYAEYLLRIGNGTETGGLDGFVNI